MRPYLQRSWPLALLLIGVAGLAGCAAGDPRFTAEAPAGFWQGLWHGMISVFTLVIGLFKDGLEVYEVHNNGAWYDFGFLFGVVCIWGHGGTKHYHQRQPRREQQEWEEIGRKVEAKLKRKLRQWAEAEDDAGPREVEAELKHRLRAWAEKE